MGQGKEGAPLPLSMWGLLRDLPQPACELQRHRDMSELQPHRRNDIGSGVCVSLILCAWVIERYSIDNLVMRMNLRVRRIAREDLFEDALEKLTIADEPAPKAVALST